MKVPPTKDPSFRQRLNDGGIMNSLEIIEKHKEIARLHVTQHQSRATRYYNSQVKPSRFEVGALMLKREMLNKKDRADGALGPN